MLHILYCGSKHFGTYSEYNSYEASAHIYKEQTQLITWPHSKGQLKKWIFKKSLEMRLLLTMLPVSYSVMILTKYMKVSIANMIAYNFATPKLVYKV